MRTQHNPSAARGRLDRSLQCTGRYSSEGVACRHRLESPRRIAIGAGETSAERVGLYLLGIGVGGPWATVTTGGEGAGGEGGDGGGIEPPASSAAEGVAGGVDGVGVVLDGELREGRGPAGAGPAAAEERAGEAGADEDDEDDAAAESR